METQKWLSAKELAAILGVNQLTVYAWLRKGRLVALRFGKRGHFRFPPSVLEDLACRASPAARAR